jgi:hypothetical protein
LEIRAIEVNQCKFKLENTFMSFGRLMINGKELTSKIETVVDPTCRRRRDAPIVIPQKYYPSSKN